MIGVLVVRVLTRRGTGEVAGTELAFERAPTRAAVLELAQAQLEGGADLVVEFDGPVPVRAVVDAVREGRALMSLPTARALYTYGDDDTDDDLPFAG